jgi:hypothetical protein
MRLDGFAGVPTSAGLRLGCKQSYHSFEQGGNLFSQAKRQLPGFDASIFAGTPAKPTAGFRRLGFVSLLFPVF